MQVSTAPNAEQRLSPYEAETLWRAWRTAKDIKARDRLVMSYAPMVRYLATRKVRAIPSHHDLDDLVSCGLIALIAAVERFDPQRGATFEQFAWTRVAGAMVDELRRLDWAPRSVRRLERETNQAREQYQRREGRVPTELELAASLGISRDALRDRLGEVERADVFSLSATVRSSDSSSAELSETIEAPIGTGDPESELLAGERVAMFKRAIDGLPAREREVFTLVHIHRVRGAEIGRMYGVSESRVSQILASARERVRVALETYDSLSTAA
jgi:RNA polymerase sigma factor for flagellar operon FliA